MANGNQPTFTDRLKDRREALFGAGDPLGLGQTPEGQAVQEAAGIQSERLSRALSGGEEFQAFPQDILATEDFFLGRAGSFLRPLIEAAAAEREAQVSATGFTIDPETGEMIVDPEVESAAQAVMGGVMKISNVPQDIRVQTAQLLSSRGYDPAKDINVTLDQLEGAFFGSDPKRGSLSGSDIALGGFLPFEFIRRGLLAGEKALGTKKGQRAEIYKRKKETFVGQLKVIAGETGVLNDRDIERLKNALPSEGDTFDQAQVMFADIRQILNAKFGNKGLPTPSEVAGEGQAFQQQAGLLGIPTASAAGMGTPTGAIPDVYTEELEGLDY